MNIRLKRSSLAACRTVLIALLFSAVPAYAFEPFVVKDIRVEGLRRTEPGTVFGYLPVKVGEVFDEEQASSAIKTLFGTGLFRDVRIETDNDVLVVIIDERPAIAKIEFAGLKDLNKDALKKALKELNLAEGRAFDRALLDRAEQEIKNQYLGRGKYGATVTTTVTPVDRNRVSITFNVDEGDVAKIKQIRILGAKVFKEGKLLKHSFDLSTGNLLSWYTKNNQYSRQKLAADLERLKSYYLDRGYMDFTVTSTQVSITPDKKGIYITVNVTEGPRYTITGIRFAGDLIVPEKEYLKLVTVHPGDIFSREKLTETTKAITDRLGNEGYAFANVNPAPEVNTAKRQVAFTIYVDPGRRVYVNRINIAGNTKTRHEIIRREMRQMESAWYNAAAINRSRERIDKLGFFDEVTVETPAVSDKTDQVDVNFNVKERRTGSLMLGAGYSSSEKVVLSASISERNLFGSGKTGTLAFDTSRSGPTYALSLTDPYFTVNGVSLGWDVYYRSYDPSKTLSVSPYKMVSAGSGFRFGIPIAEDDMFSFGLSFDRSKITTYRESDNLYHDFCNDFKCKQKTGADPVLDYGVGKVDVNSLIASLGWGRDSRDSYIYPTKGNYQQLYGEVATPAGDIRYGKATYQFQHWFPIGSNGSSLMFNTEFGYAKGLGGKPVPFYKNFYAGGIGSVRGYESSSLGPTDDEGDAIGGTRKFVGNLEYFLPSSSRNKAFRWSLFVDAGYVWGTYRDREPVTNLPIGKYKNEKIRGDDIRYSGGLGLIWTSPLGPLKFSLAYPIKKKTRLDRNGNEVKDDIRPFDFSMGMSF